MRTKSLLSFGLEGLVITSSVIVPQCVYSQKQAQQARRPNVLFIQTDQQRAATMAVYGNTQFDVPNMNKLADKSVVFMKSYCTQPVSTPSRGCIMTGMYPKQHGALGNNQSLFKESKCLPELMNDSAYISAYFGKWHLGNEVFTQHGFNEFSSCEDMYLKHFSPDKDNSQRSGYFHYLLSKGYFPDDKENNTFSRNFVTRLPYIDGKPKWLSTMACQFMEKHKDQPFVLYVDYLEPHTPFNGPFNELHKPEDLTLGANLNVELTENDPTRYKLMKVKQTNETVLATYRKYAGLCHSVDLSLGEIMKKLEDLGLADNTIIVFTADHGEMMGAHGLQHKSVMYEEAIKVPLLIRVPWLQSKQLKVDNPTTNINLIPTLMELLGKSTNAYPQLQGKSLVSLIKGENIPKETVFIMWNPNGDDDVSHAVGDLKKEDLKKFINARFRTAVSPDGWKLSLSDVDKNQLFNLKNDPYELENLYYSGKYKDVIKDLRAQIIAWQKRISDECPLSE